MTMVAVVPAAEGARAAPSTARVDTAAAQTAAVSTVADGLTIPWGLDFTPDGDLLFTERPGGISILTANGDQRTLNADLSDLWVSGETGLMDLAVDPTFAGRRVYTCQGYRSGGDTDVRVIAWQLNEAKTSLDRLGPLLAGFPTSSGRHGGCRIAFGPDGAMFVGTGDAAIGTTPQDPTSYGGKLLRVDRFSGQGLADNPFAGSDDPVTQRVWSWGHRNTQGLARRGDGSMWSVEHGPGCDDEINRGVSGNFGWDPVPGYNESVPMTDLAKFPDAVGAAWSSGCPTVATSGATWVNGIGWGGWDDTLAVATLKDESLRIFAQTAENTVTQIATPIDGTYGRLRTPVLGPQGDLFVATANGGGNDRILRVPPEALDPPKPEEETCFTESAYATFLGRAPIEDEVKFWLAAFSGDVPRSALPRFLATSDEWLSGEVTRLYDQVLDREPEPGGLGYWVDRLQAGTAVRAVAARIYGSGEFYARAGGTDTAFVRDLYSRILEREADEDGVTFWTGEVADRGRDGVAAALFASVESRTRRVERLYQRVLGRAPEPAGRRYWVQRLSSVGDVRLAVALASSGEFYARAQQDC